MKEYYIEVYYPPFPSRGLKFRVFRKRGSLNRDTLSPDLMTLYWVQARDREDAIARTLEGEARAVIGGKKAS